MKDLTKYFIDLSKCSEEQRNHIYSIMRDRGEFLKFDSYTYDSWKMLNYSAIDKGWLCSGYNWEGLKDKTELTYPEFIKLFEGGEDNNGWIKIGDDGRISYDGDIWGVDKYNRCVHYFSEEDFIEIGYLTHYQPVVKPEPPKF